MRDDMQTCQHCGDYHGAECDMVDISKDNELPLWICQACAFEIVQTMQLESIDSGIPYQAPIWIRQLRVI